MSRNAKTGAEYRGENAEVLMRMELAAKYKHDTWATYNQWQELGFQVKKGEKGVGLKFFTRDERGENGEVEKKGGLRFFRVFNIAQVDEIKPMDI